MFFSSDLLVQKSNGLGTAWLVATLGPKSSFKRIQKKDILKVSIPAACKVIIDPPAPLALRLSSSLLYGLITIYEQQAGFLFSDISGTHTRLRHALINTSTTVDAGQSMTIEKPWNYMLLDDPTFVIDFGLLPLNYSAPIDDLQLDSELSLLSATQSTGESSYLEEYPEITIPERSHSVFTDESINDHDLGRVTFEFGDEGTAFETDPIVFDNDHDDEVGSSAVVEFPENALLDDLFTDENGNQVDVSHGPQTVIAYNDAKYQIPLTGTDGFPVREARLLDSDAIGPPSSKRRKILRPVVIDEKSELATSILRQNRDNYRLRMAQETRERAEKAEARFIKVTVPEYFVYGGYLVGSLSDTFKSSYLEYKPTKENPISNQPEPEVQVMSDADDLPFFDEIEIPRVQDSIDNLVGFQSSSMLPWNASAEGLHSSAVGRSRQQSLSYGGSSASTSPTKRYSSDGSNPYRQSRRLSRRVSDLFADGQEELPDYEPENTDSDILLNFDRLQQEEQNFYDYIAMRMDMLQQNQLTFTELIEPEISTRPVAAQGLMQLLSLLSAGAVTVAERIEQGLAEFDIQLAF
ncbi:Rec8 like protein-domain-containing protein [Lipomyces oligophaga]|uniref:Rec8 like protein-domain-containing protein n=1 Tax=Lipomyces oligophaga TaxID=45792 RepID=UPI0034CDE0B1